MGEAAAAGRREIDQTFSIDCPAGLGMPVWGEAGGCWSFWRPVTGVPGSDSDGACSAEGGAVGERGRCDTGHKSSVECNVAYAET